MIRSFRGTNTSIAVSAYVDPSAVVIGDVRIGERSSIWPNVTIRGDVDHIEIGAETSIQDGTVLHCDAGVPLSIGDRVTVGHLAMLHGCTVEDDALIGIGAIVLNGARVGKGAVVAADHWCRRARRFRRGCWRWEFRLSLSARCRLKNRRGSLWA